MKKTVFDTKNKVEYEFNMSDVREALIDYFKITLGTGKNWECSMEIIEGFLSRPPKISMVISNVKKTRGKQPED